MAWYIWMEDGPSGLIPRLGYGNNMEEARRNGLSHAPLSYQRHFSPTDESWLKSEIEKLEQERRNLKIPPDPPL